MSGPFQYGLILRIILLHKAVQLECGGLSSAAAKLVEDFQHFGRSETTNGKSVFTALMVTLCKLKKGYKPAPGSQTLPLVENWETDSCPLPKLRTLCDNEHAETSSNMLHGRYEGSRSFGKFTAVSREGKPRNGFGGALTGEVVGDYLKNIHQTTRVRRTRPKP
jgi:hypothetical protein